MFRKIYRDIHHPTHHHLSRPMTTPLFQRATTRTIFRIIAAITGIAALCGISFFVGALTQSHADEKQPSITRGIVESAEKLIGLHFTDVKRDSLLQDLTEARTAYEEMRAVQIPNSIPPAFVFNPLPEGFTIPTAQKPFDVSRYTPTMPKTANRDDLAFYSIGELAALIKARTISSVELTTFFLERLKRYGSQVNCTITLTEELALAEARRADEELAQGKYRGLLHGIPYGAKDLFAVKGYPTTWGSLPYKAQRFDDDATVITRMREAGAVLVAKLTLGELAMGDRWFGGMTRNPWNLDQGSSGSSAGSAAATAAGLIPCAIGTETYGSIVSPSTRCGTTGLRPTFGRVSRTGAMALSWTLDKIGPICRTVEDCAIVFEAIRGTDGKDASVHDAPFNYSPTIDLKRIRIGYVKSLFENAEGFSASDSAALAVMRSLGATLVPIELPPSQAQYKGFSLNSLDFIIGAEASAAFDVLTRSGTDSLMAQQTRNAWPNIFRAARFIPATEYIQANRIRTMLVNDMAQTMKDVDVYIAPSFEGGNLLLTNLTGHPCVVLPSGFRTTTANGRTVKTPLSITFCGRLFDEATLLAVAKRYQDATDFHKQHPRFEK
jgi:Asp-tRNA(Asn)/Glu-tRNA(Gln) amidotransferase A subunit family amidase